MAALTSTSLASEPLQEDPSEAETLNWREGSGRSGREATTPAGGVLNATPEPWEGFTSLVEALDILSTLDQQSHLKENAIDGEDEDSKRKGKTINRRMVEDAARNMVEEEGEEGDKEERLIFTGLQDNQDHQVTISVNNMWSAVAWIVLLAFLIKWLVHVATGKDLSYWGLKAMNS